MNYWFLVLLVILGVAILFIFSRPSTISDSNSKGRYFILNRLTGRACYNGRTFRTYRGAIRAYKKLDGINFLHEMFEIRKLLS